MGLNLRGSGVSQLFPDVALPWNRGVISCPDKSATRAERFTTAPCAESGNYHPPHRPPLLHRRLPQVGTAPPGQPTCLPGPRSCADARPPDPLIELKRRETRIENELAVLQAEQGRRRRARKLDPEQTLDEQAYAAALASRWRLIDRPHTRLPTPPKWRLVGFLLDEDSEKYLHAIGEHRITEIGRKVASATEPGFLVGDDSGRE